MAADTNSTIVEPKSLAPTYSINDPSTKLYVGDSRELLPKVAAPESVDLIYADPPFNWKRDYDRHEAGDAWDDSIPDNEYMQFTYDWLDECVSLLAPHGALWVNIPDDWAAEIVVHLKQRKLKMVNWCVWHYRFGQNNRNKFISSKVHALYFMKDYNHPDRRWNIDVIEEPSDRATTYSDKRTFAKKQGNSGMRTPMDVWYGKNWGRIQGNNKERRPGHDNQIPEMYMERVIRGCSHEGDLVLDPFCGSGTTATVARELNRKSITCEYAPSNAKSAWERISELGPYRVKRDEPTLHVNPIFSNRAPGGVPHGQEPAEQAPDQPADE